jgi:predicted Zn-dependent protease with MMP-like domain
MDLLTAIAYELGHLLGYEHSEDGTMHYMLVAGERHMPTTGVGPRQLAIFDAIFIEEKEEETSDRVAHVLLSDFNLSRFLM